MEANWIEHLMSTYSTKLRQYINSHVDTREDAEDLLQDVFINCYKHQDEFDHERCPELAWLYIIAKNRLKMYYRDKKHIDSLELLAENGIVPEDSLAGQAMEIIENRDLIAQVLNKLDDRSRAVIVFRYFEQYSVRETAQRLGMAEGNVRVVQSRALKDMQKMLRHKSLDE